MLINVLVHLHLLNSEKNVERGGPSWVFVSRLDLSGTHVSEIDMNTATEQSTKNPSIGQSDIGGQWNRDEQEEKVGDGQIDDVAVGHRSIILFAKGNDENNGIA